MQPVSASEKQFEELGSLLEDMKEYLQKLERGCRDFSVLLDGSSITKSLGILTQIMDGLHYYLKLLKSAAALLTIDLSEIVYETMSISSLFNHLSQIYTSIIESIENEDYSLLTDLIEYDLLPAICISQGILVVVQERYQERAK
jgi:hypothetical protein